MDSPDGPPALNQPPAVNGSAGLTKLQTRGSAPPSGPPAVSGAHIPGEVGIWVLIFGDLSVFAVMYGIFVVYRDKTPRAFAVDQHYLHSIFGVGNTLLLLTSSLAVVLAVRSLRAAITTSPGPVEAARYARRAKVCLGVAIACGLWFLLNKGLEWGALLSHHHHPSGNNFFTYFFVLTGLHAVHVCVGLGLLVTMVRVSRRPVLTRGNLIFLEAAACFWHMVDLIWIVLFALLYLAH